MSNVKRHDGWYYRAAANEAGDIFHHAGKEHAPPSEGKIGELYGPFDRFGMAKTDAIRFYQDEIAKAQECIAKIKRQNEVKLKKRAVAE